jgi:prolyl oligopeptidase
VTDEYQGVKVVDEYRWLEKSNDPEVKKWMDAQNDRARDYLSTLPHAKDIQARVKELISATPPGYFRIGQRSRRLFAIKFQAPKQQPFLVRLTSPEDTASEKMLVDPNGIDAKGTTAIDFYSPSLDGKRVAVSLSRNGTEEGDVHVYDVETGKELGDVVPRVNGGTAGGALTWNADTTGFWYSRYPRGNERPAADMAFYTQVWFHKLGTKTEDDDYCVGKEFPRIAEIGLVASDDGKYVLVQIANGDGGEFAYWLRSPDDKWTQFANYEDKVIRATFGGDGNVYLLSRKNAPKGKVLRLDPAAPELSKSATVVETSADVSIENVAATKSSLYVIDRVGGPSQLRVFDLEKGGLKRIIPILPVSTVGQVARLDVDDVLFSNQSFIDPRSWFRIGGADGEPVKTAMSTLSPSTSATPRWCASTPSRRTTPRSRSTSSARKAPSSTTPIPRSSGATVAMGSTSSRSSHP